jgi:hypothetical protein
MIRIRAKTGVALILLGLLSISSSLSAQSAPKSVRPSESVTIVVRDPGGENAWVGLYKVDARDVEPISFAFLRDLKNHVFSVNAPRDLGEYHFRIFKDRGYDLAYKGHSIIVEQYKPTFTLSGQMFEPYETITVTYSDEPIETDAWIGFYRTPDPDDRFITFIELKHLGDRTYSVKAPPERGTYNFRIFLDNGYTMVGKSADVTVR